MIKGNFVRMKKNKAIHLLKWLLNKKVLPRNPKGVGKILANIMSRQKHGTADTRYWILSCLVLSGMGDKPLTLVMKDFQEFLCPLAFQRLIISFLVKV